ncbi:hypothetical protein ASE74_02730 [Pedobacter sp. Leaf216]|uniref:hypothetical protein n=1 Tax=Pedobacter sp. Leaf216 TaxID=1735684 RepID=UPI0006FAA9C6|nr:hypothetical protein [Pedobacter sp. Leaf216]KQM74915.1 hypothetical protein ASE74_02730 [Pedobacter sp. Leaf216]
MKVFKTLAFIIIASFILIVSPAYVFAQKAFEYEYYVGKTKDMTIKLSLADGYIAASEIRTVGFKSKKTSLFLTETGYEQAGLKMKFYHDSASQKEFPDYFIVDNIRDAYEQLPKEMHGEYYFKNEVIAFTLKISAGHR